MVSKIIRYGTLTGVAGGELWLGYRIYCCLRTERLLRISQKAGQETSGYSKTGPTKIFVFEVSTPLSLTAISRFASTFIEMNLKPKAVILTLEDLCSIPLLCLEPLEFAIKTFKKNNVSVGWVNESRKTSPYYERFFSSLKPMVQEFPTLGEAKRKLGRCQYLSIVQPRPTLPNSQSE